MGSGSFLQRMNQRSLQRPDNRSREFVDLQPGDLPAACQSAEVFAGGMLLQDSTQEVYRLGEREGIGPGMNLRRV
jgi:hypothetical protein